MLNEIIFVIMALMMIGTVGAIILWLGIEMIKEEIKERKQS